MRIIAGKFKGKNLNEFKISTTRPTADMVREAFFDKIGFEILDKKFLDLFAGTGAVGIEALSRGASECWFVDEGKEAYNLVLKNLQLVGERQNTVLNKDFKSALSYFKNQNIKFDFIFLDPPYKTNFAEEAIEIIYNYNLIADNGCIIWEHDESKLQYVENIFKNAKTKKYGKKYLSYIYA